MTTLLLILSCSSMTSVEVLSEEPCSIPAEGWSPLHLDGFEAGAFGLPGIAAGRFV